MGFVPPPLDQDEFRRWWHLSQREKLLPRLFDACLAAAMRGQDSHALYRRGLEVLRTKWPLPHDQGSE